MLSKSEFKRLEYLTKEELWKKIRMRTWNAFEAACYIQGIKPFCYEEFLKNRSHYPEIDDYYKIFIEPRRLRLCAPAFGKKMVEWDPLVWIKIASESHGEKWPIIECEGEDENISGLYMAPGIGEAWAIHQERSQKMYVNPKTGKEKSINKDSMEKQITHKKKKVSGRPLHEPDDRDYFKFLGRTMYRKYNSLKKKEIVEIIRENFPRAICYNPVVITKWLRSANIAPAKKGRPEKILSI